PPSRRLLAVLAGLLLLARIPHGGGQDPPPTAGKLQSLSLETNRIQDGRFVLRGRDAGQQLLVTGRTPDGLSRDLTRQVSYHVAPPGVVAVDATGYASALAEGQATITATGPGGLSVRAAVTVTDLTNDLPVNFANDVVPIFTRHGCN